MPTTLQPPGVSNETSKSITPTSPEAGFEGLEEVQAPPAAEAGFEGLTPVVNENGQEPGFENAPEADRLDLEDKQALINDDSFRPAEVLAQNPNLQNQGGDRFQKLLDIYRAKRIKGLEAGKVLKAAVTEAPGVIGKTVKGIGQLASRAVDIAVNPAVNEILGFAEYVGTRGKSSPSALREETRKRQLKAAAEIGAGTESAMAGLAQLGTEGYRKVFGKAPAEQTDNELYDQLLVDAEFHKATKDAFSGEGDFAKSTGLNASYLEKNGITLDKGAIENLSLVDPLTLVATAGVFKVVTTGGKILATAATKAGAQAVINGLTKVGSQVATKSLNVAGRGVAAAGRAVQKVPLRTPSMAATGAQLATGNIPGAVTSAVAPTAIRTTGRVLERVGQTAAQVGEQLNPNFIGPRTATVARLAEIASSPAAKVVKTAAQGAVGGAVASAPLALASQDSQTAGAILGGGTALGALAGGAVGGKNELANVVAKKYLDPHSIPFQPTESKGYGVEPTLDQTHEAAIQQLAPNDQNMVNTFREALRDQGGEIYVQDPASYLERIKDTLVSENGGQPLTPEQEALAQTYADTHAYLDTFRTDADGQQRRIVFLNNSAKGLPHDAGHLFQSLMSPEKQAQLREAVFDSYTPEQLNDFAQGYVDRLGDPEYFQKLGPEAGRAKVADEIVAENFSQLFGNTQLSNLKAPPKFIDTLARTAVEAGEALGVDLTGGRVTPDLQATPAYKLQNILRNASREVLNLPKAKEKSPLAPKAEELVPKEAAPTEAPTPAEISPEAPASPIAETPKVDETARRATETGTEVARLLTEDKPEARAAVEQIAQAMESGKPTVRIEHRGITAETEGKPRAAGRTSRRGTQEAGYAELERLQIENRKEAPESVVQTHEKTFVPVRWVEQGGKATLVAMSIDKVMANLRRVVTDATVKKATDLIPYETFDGKLTEAGWNDALNDFRTYSDNQAHGYRGDGQQLIRPSDELGASIPAEDPNFSPTALDENKVNFLNLIQGLNPPRTGRTIKGQTPGNVKGQVIAEINKRAPQPVAKVSPEDLTKQSFAAPFENRTVKETNPLRNELASRGVNTRNLLEVTERLAADDIASVGEAETQFNAPVTDTIRGGFLPKEQIDAEVKRRVEESKKNGIPVDERKRKQIQQQVDFDARNGRLGQAAGKGATFFLPKAKPNQPTPSSDIRDLASNYAKSSGIEYHPSRDFAPLPTELLKEIADLYDAAQSAPEDPAVQASYRALANETVAQYRAMEAAGYKIEPFKGEGEPYKSSQEAVADIRDNKHLYFLKTDNAFGTGEQARNNPMLADSGVSVNGEPLLVNDVFRAVHDFFGHGKEGYQFGPRGEFNAWRTHSEMFSPQAQGALAAETLAQNAWVNTGKHLRNADGSIPQKGEAGYVPPQNRPFADQKNIVIPDNVISRARKAAGEVKFLPEGKTVEEYGRELLDAPADAFKPAMDAIGGLTGGAWDLGMRLTRAEDVQVLKNLAAEASVKAKEFMQAGDFTNAMPAVMKGQFFREAYEAATGTASVKKAMENGRMPAGYKPPFPEAEAGDKSFLPKRKTGSAAAPEDLKKVERDDQGRPLTRDGLVDYERLYKEMTAEQKAKDAADMAELDKKVAAGKYKVEESQKAKGAGKGLTGWILPDDEFVPLDTQFHEQWLGKNSKRLNEDFGTNFGDKVTAEERFDAVNKGFVRIRYTPNDGTVRIEASAKNWTPKTRRTLLDKLEQHANSIDRIYAAVMDEKGNIVDSSSERVMELEGPDKVAAFENTLDGLNAGTTEGPSVEPGMIKRAREGFGEPAAGSDITELGPKQRAFLPKQGSKEFDSYVRERIKASKEFPEAIPLEGVKDNDGHYRTQYGDEPLFVTEPWDFNDSPLAKENRGDTVAESEELYTDALAKKLESAYEDAKKNPDVEAGETWYSVAREKIQKLLGDDAQFFAELLGATSPNTAVDVNFGYAVEAYNLYKKGYYDKLIEKYREGKEAFRNGETEEFSKETGKTGKKATEKAFLTWWSEKHNLEPMSDRVNPKTGQHIKFGFHTQPVMRVLDRSWLQQVEGPKTPNFTGNLSGATFQATIDVWAARLLRRLSYEGVSDKPWRIHSIAEQGVGEKDFYTGQKAFRKAADALGIQPDALQAILWFAEKDHWEKRGWTKLAGAKKADYNVLLQTASKSPEGQLSYVKPSDLAKAKNKKAKVDKQPELPNLNP